MKRMLKNVKHQLHVTDMTIYYSIKRILEF